MTPTDAAPLAEAWAALTRDGSLESTSPVRLNVTGRRGQLASHFAVEETAVACIGTALLAAAQLQRRSGMEVTLDRGHVAAAVRSERYFVGAAASGGLGFAPLSRFWPAADGWVRTHGNYPWHRAALASALGVVAEADPIAAAITQLRAIDVEERVFAAGGIAAAVRSIETWREHPQGRALAGEPLIHHEVIGGAAARSPALGSAPASGMRVLDLTRVIAGPVCTRFLAALGADVLRIDPPHRPDLDRGDAGDTLLGKRSAIVDLRSAAGAGLAHELLDSADVIVCGYRPGALDGFGLDPRSLAERHPGLVAVYLDAWGHTGPWSGRRGFDSVVQAPTGIALGESRDGVAPGTLPCQLLDHGTGYLAAAAALDGLRRQREIGGTHVRRLSLARTAVWLTGTLRAARDATSASEGQPDWAVEVRTSAGAVVRAVAPPGALDGRALSWPEPLTGYGDDPAAWSS